jgi:hypothetical protein
MFLLLPLIASVGIHIEQRVGVDPARTASIALSLARAIEAQSGVQVQVDALDAGVCAKDQRCLDEVRARLGATELILLRVVGGITRIRLVGSRLGPRGVEPSINEATDLASDGADQRSRIGALVARLFPEPTRSSREIGAVLSPAAAAREPWLWRGSAIAAALSAGVGSFLLIQSENEHHDLETQQLLDPQYFSTRDQMHRDRALGGALIAAAVVLAGSALVLLLD